MAVPKPDGRVRLCGDFRITVNQVLQVDPYPLPKAEDLFATLAGGKKFTKLDLSQAYLQMELHPDSVKYCTVNTSQGTVPVHAASVWNILSSCTIPENDGYNFAGTFSYIDDILVTGTTEEEHLKNLEETLRRAQAHGMRMKKSKCRFMRDSVEYLGHKVDAEGIRATPEKIAAIVNAPLPQCTAAEILPRTLELLPKVLA